ncbi:acyl-CoA reductase [Proteiniclasticum sp. SCR006]|uniref:Acyl-CoA reductase n=1 Tax=Proteiniclasticum aestuarii TaxID=2817862 RepID=A0A939KH95_9CLOT|nr:BadF/BadG/BcrA/BcrD ATPase family protein [Proteiniclasticum aestuarii]MBO1265229.1 acyl-CoA reductase [Proteiniclasticum aestuarii]
MKYICVDAGGTKTRFALYNEDGKVLDQEVLPSCHFMKVGYEGMVEILHEGYSVLKDRNDFSENELILSLGLAGYGREEKIRRSIETALADKFRNQRYVLHNDIEIAMEAAFSGRDGIMLIAGTGSIAFCRHQGKMRRSGGWGYLFGDEGSAYWLGRKLLEVFSKEEDGRLEKSLIYDLLMKHLKLQHGHDLITYVRETLGNRREDIAKLALILYKAASGGDKRALELYDEAAKELASLVIAAGRETTGDVDVAYFGGVFEAKELILDPLRAYLPERFTLNKPEGSPEYGAYLLAKKD